MMLLPERQLMKFCAHHFFFTENKPENFLDDKFLHCKPNLKLINPISVLLTLRLYSNVKLYIFKEEKRLTGLPAGVHRFLKSIFKSVVPKLCLKVPFLQMVHKSLFLRWFGAGCPVTTINRKQQQALNKYFFKTL